jgi:ABC-type multidrug transport system fused ATPase/permease subunit
MLKAIKASLAFMTPRERFKWYFLTAFRALLSLLDLAGILAIGFVVTSTAIFLTAGSSPDRVLNFAGLEIPAVTAQSLPVVSGAILTVFLLKAILSIAITRATAFFVAKIEARAARQIAERVFGGDLAEARLRSREEMSFAIQFGSPAAFNSLLNFSSTVVAEATLFILICFGFVLIDPIATIAAIVYFALVAFLIHYFVGTLMARAGQVAAENTIEANSAVGDLIAVFRELSVLRLRHRYVDKIYKSRIAAAESAATQTYLGGMPRYIIEAALLVGVASFILVQAVSGDIIASAATIGVFLSGGFRLTAAMLPFQAALLTIKATIPSARTAHEILNQPTPRPTMNSNLETINSIPTPTLEPIGVEFDRVSLTYADSETKTLNEVSFRVLPGQQIALIGPSGAGKSTIADLMCGVLSPSEGYVHLSCPSKPKLVFADASIGYVPQSPGLVVGTVIENVALGLAAGEADEDRVMEAIKSAHLEDVVSELPSGVYTELGKYQEGFSGGQVQRLGLARALYSKPGLLVMDEATSALDAVSESEISKALETMRGSVTVVLIAHRLNTVQHADKVFLIESGRVVDSGTFQELVTRNPSVERLVNLMRVEKD